uniref:Uncharacterized protein n=1 Tax=Peronospora matthiolae TaxID=2874970 RepID=A0AAV1V1R2_9STRA
MEMEVRAAVKTGDVAKLQKLLDTGVHLDTKDQDERTPLHWACTYGRLDVAEFLMEQVRASIDVQDDAKWTPLEGNKLQSCCWTVRRMLTMRIVLGAPADAGAGWQT